MARKPTMPTLSRPPVPQREIRRAQVDVSFDNQSLLGALFGQFDANLVQVENRLGVFISARGDQIHIEGPEDAVARARGVLQTMYDKLALGEDLDGGLIESIIAMSDEPTLDGIVRGDTGGPPIMIRTRRKTIVPRSPTQTTYMRSLARDDIIFALGPAGTGKTYLAVAQAVSQLITGSVQRLILSRPAVEAGEKLGFLPGDMKDKVDPFLRPLYDALYDCMPPEQVERRLASGEIEIAPIAFMRGRTLADAFIILALGPAGTGKTYLAVAQAVSQLITGSVQRLILSRPAVEAGEKLGFLPGDMKDKVDPFLRPLYDALYDCMPPEQVERRLASGEIEIAPIAFMRGRTLADAFIILDEAQNTTREQMKMFLTRFGQNSRMVVCGDPRQVDIPGGDGQSGLADAVSRLENVDGFGTIRFTAADVVRHPIVGRIVEAYEG